MPDSFDYQDMNKLWDDLKPDTEDKPQPHVHESDGQMYLTCPPQFKCKVCGEYYPAHKA